MGFKHQWLSIKYWLWILRFKSELLVTLFWRLISVNFYCYFVLKYVLFTCTNFFFWHCNKIKHYIKSQKLHSRCLFSQKWIWKLSIIKFDAYYIFVQSQTFDFYGEYNEKCKLRSSLSTYFWPNLNWLGFGFVISKNVLKYINVPSDFSSDIFTQYC